MMNDNRKDLPPVTSPNFLEKVREALSVYLGHRGDSLDQGLTRRDLQDFGAVDKLVSSKLKSTVSSAVAEALPLFNEDDNTYEADLTPPPMPTGFSASAAITNLIVECAAPVYTQGHGHSKARLYGATWQAAVDPEPNPPLPVFADAVMLTEFVGTVFSYATNPSTTWHLWLKWVSVDGVESTSPAGGTNGVVVTTGADVSLLLKALTEEITNSQLHPDLGTRIDLVDAPETGIVAQLLGVNEALSSINASIADLENTPVYDPLVTYALDDVVSYSGGLYKALGATTGNLPTNATYWIKIGDYASLADAVAGHAIIISDHATRVTTAEGNITSIAGRATVLETAVNSPTTGLSTKASITYVDTAKSDAISSAASTTALVEAKLNVGGSTYNSIVAAQTAANNAQTKANTAFTNAATAQTAANTANTELTNIASDNILSPSEKPPVVQDYAVITGEQAGIDAQATSYGITTEKTNYDTAVSALTTYLGSLSGWNTVPGSNVTIVGTTFRSKFSDVYTKRQLLLNAISAKAKLLANTAQAQADTATTNAATAQATANTAVTNAATAQTTANTAVTNAATANSLLSDIASDSKLTAVEKSAVRTEWDVVAAEKSVNNTQATTFAVTTENTTYNSAFQALATYLNAGTTWASGVPSWISDANIGVTTTIVGATFRTTWKTYYDARTALLNAIALKAKTLAEAAQVQADTAVTNAATAQTTANTAVTNAAAVADRATTLETTVNNPTTGLATKASVTQVATAKSEAIAASASVTDTISARLNSGDFAAVKIESSANASSVTGLLAQYTVKLDVGGKVSGFGLASSASSSAFSIRADRFYIAPPETGGGSATEIIPFTVQATATTVNGVSVPAGVYINDAYIKNGTITTAKIGNAQIDDAKVANLSASKLTAGTIDVEQYIQSSGYTTGSNGWRINGNGVAEFTGVIVRGTVYAEAGLIGGITISDSAVRAGQSAYNTGVGFYLGSNGRFSVGNSAGNRLTWDTSVLSIVGALTATSISTNSGKFSVGADGVMNATDGFFSGTVSAGSVDFASSVGITLPKYTTAGTFSITVPAKMTRMRVTLYGGGGGGRAGSNRSTDGSYVWTTDQNGNSVYEYVPGAVAYGGGAGGSQGQRVVTTIVVTPGSTYTLVVGAGGAAGTTLSDGPYYTAPAAPSGSATYISGYVSAAGGAGGALYSGIAPLAYGYYPGGNGGGPAGGAGGTYAVGGTGGVDGSGGGGGYGTYATTSGHIQANVGGPGGPGSAVIEFFDPAGVVLRSEMDTLKNQLNAQGVTVT